MLSRQPHNELQRNYYSGPLKWTLRPGAAPYIRRHLREVIRFGELRAGERVLDAGCGAGGVESVLERIPGLKPVLPFVLMRAWKT